MVEDLTGKTSESPPSRSLWERVRNVFIGKPLDPTDRNIFHSLSLIAFFAWVGLGADGLSSSCYGPEEAFVALQGHTHLAIFVGIATVFTIFVISASYSQIIELFPTGGGGYLVASKLLSPSVGMVSGCALLIDYVLTITISVASGADALFSFLPGQWLPYKLHFAALGIVFLSVLNLRGAKESVLPLVPVFMTFVVTHVAAILYALISHGANLPTVVSNTAADVQSTYGEMGLAGMFFLILRAYSLGAGTYTGIEAVSNGVPMLREPKVQTGRRTMRYMAISLSFTVMGLMLAYLLYEVERVPGKTLNAVLFESIVQGWGGWGTAFVLITLISEAAILFVAAQAGFLDGPRVLANMSLDRWFSTRFAMLSDRFVAQNGVLIMGGAGLLLLLLTGGSVHLLIVFYSINVFITFLLSQLGMVRHWWINRSSTDHWKKRLTINGIGLILTTFILISITVIKFHEGGWVTLLVTGSLVAVCALIKRHYTQTISVLKRLDGLVEASQASAMHVNAEPQGAPDFGAKTAVILVNGYNGLGLHTLFSVIQLFGDIFKNYVFIQVGIVDAGNFKGISEVEKLRTQVNADVEKYVQFMKKNGYYAEAYSSIANDVVDEVSDIAPRIIQKFPKAIFFGGQLVFPNDSLLTRFLHNYTVFAMQRRFYHQGIPIVVLPIRV